MAKAVKKEYMKEDLVDCGDCGAKPGEIHSTGCDLEICSVCGGQYIGCFHKGHDKSFARWTGIYDDIMISEYLGIDLEEFYNNPKYKFFNIKPKKGR
jgi:hypothetical protein